MKRFIACMIALAFSMTPLCAQDIPLSKILVEKEDWREVAKGVPDITLLEAEPAGSITIFQRAALSARLGVNGKVEKASTPEGENINRNERVVIARSGA